jgi:hypothetical protein
MFLRIVYNAHPEDAGSRFLRNTGKLSLLRTEAADFSETVVLLFYPDDSGTRFLRNVKLETTGSSENLITTYQITRRHNRSTIISGNKAMICQPEPKSVGKILYVITSQLKMLEHFVMLDNGSSARRQKVDDQGYLSKWQSQSCDGP